MFGNFGVIENWQDIMSSTESDVIVGRYWGGGAE